MLIILAFLVPFAVAVLGRILAKVVLASDARAQARRGYAHRPVDGDNIVGRDRGKLEEGVLLRPTRD